MYCTSCETAGPRYARNPNQPGARHCSTCALAFGLDVTEGSPHYCETLEQCFPTVRDLFRAMVSGDLDDIEWSDLPLYGGNEPTDTQNVWSWDATSLIVGTCRDDLQMVPRRLWGWLAVDHVLAHGGQLKAAATGEAVDLASARLLATADAVSVYVDR